MTTITINKEILHDLKNDFQVIHSLLELFVKKNESNLDPLINRISSKLNSALGLFKEILVPNERNQSITKSVSEIMNDLKLDLEESLGIKIHILGASNILFVENDFKRIVTNCILNAKEAGATRIKMTLTSSRIVMADNGQGLSLETIAKINKQDFFSTKGEGRGSGVRSIFELAKRNGFRVKYAIDPGAGGGLIIFENIKS